MSTESLARSATETRIIKALVPCCACPSARAGHTIAKGRESGQYAGPTSGLRRFSGEAGGIKAIEPAPARVGIGQV